MVGVSLSKPLLIVNNCTYAIPFGSPYTQTESTTGSTLEEVHKDQLTGVCHEKSTYFRVFSREVVGQLFLVVAEVLPGTWSGGKCV